MLSLSKPPLKAEDRFDDWMFHLYKQVASPTATQWASPGAIGSTTPSSGAFTTLSATGVITSTLATGTAPFTITSTTVVGNLNVSQLLGKTWAVPGTIGSTTPSTGAFTTLVANSFTPDSSTAPANGIYLPATNEVGITSSKTVANQEVARFSGTGVTLGGTSAAPSISIVPSNGNTAWPIVTASNGANPKIGVNANNLVLGTGAALATNATAGHLMIPSCAGAPTGAPTGAAAGQIAFIFDSTGHQLYAYFSGTWYLVSP